MNNILIKDIPISERPRERLVRYGVKNLSNEELISIILKTGTKEVSVKDLSTSILSKCSDISIFSFTLLISTSLLSRTSSDLEWLKKKIK